MDLVTTVSIALACILIGGGFTHVFLWRYWRDWQPKSKRSLKSSVLGHVSLLFGMVLPAVIWGTSAAYGVTEMAVATVLTVLVLWLMHRAAWRAYRERMRKYAR